VEGRASGCSRRRVRPSEHFFSNNPQERRTKTAVSPPRIRENVGIPRRCGRARPRRAPKENNASPRAGPTRRPICAPRHRPVHRVACY
jgi:hypothetical protein